MTTHYELYLRGHEAGVKADKLMTDQNPYSDHHLRQGWDHGKMLAVTLAREVTGSTLALFLDKASDYWKAHARGAAAAGLRPLGANPYGPKGWDNLQCPPSGRQLEWHGWYAGWRFASGLC